MLDRAYSLVRIKDIDDEQRIVRGIATTPTTDRHGDIVEPLGAKYAPDLPLFLYHDSRETVGRTRLGKATRNGIPFEATLPKVTEFGRLRDRVDEAWQMLKYRLITGVSIGFRADWDDVEELSGQRWRPIQVHRNPRTVARADPGKQRRNDSGDQVARHRTAGRVRPRAVRRRATRRIQQPRRFGESRPHGRFSATTERQGHEDNRRTNRRS